MSRNNASGKANNNLEVFHRNGDDELMRFKNNNNKHTPIITNSREGQ